MNPEGGEENWLSNWEQECAESIENQPNYEQSVVTESNGAHSKIWSAFQGSATAVAQLYRDRYLGDPTVIWVQFQTAAGTVTSLYRESMDSLKRTTELAKQGGYQKRNLELVNWAKRKRRLIRREDLLAYLAGKHPPPPSRSTHHHHHSHHRLSPRPRNISPPPGLNAVEPLDSSLRTFREALVSTPFSCLPKDSELCDFITGEMVRHNKRSASPPDVTMGSPTQQKRPRYM